MPFASHTNWKAGKNLKVASESDISNISDLNWSSSRLANFDDVPGHILGEVLRPVGQAIQMVVHGDLETYDG